ncbi:MAG TPA: hypothetical protein VGE08_14945 [Steroidobacter sp.]|uniref:hypothetical protein n=1 Tax=Steroidobacter sp. TaxID=1978227 RepID=UPI002ED7D019
MKAYYLLSIVAAGVISTVVGTGLVAAGTGSEVRSETVTVQSESLELLKAQSDTSNMTWRRPL